AWTVFHHGSALGAANPQLTVRNLYGDPYPFALCPSRPAVRAFSRQLAAAIASTGHFDTLDLETIGYLGYFHGHHHEVSAAPCGPLAHYRRSRCSCEACPRGASHAGLPIFCRQQYLRDLLTARFEADDAGREGTAGGRKCRCRHDWPPAVP